MSAKLLFEKKDEKKERKMLKFSSEDPSVCDVT